MPVPSLLHAKHTEQSELTAVAGKANTTAQAINSDGGQAIPFAGDITDSACIDNLIQKAAGFGGGTINVTINNAGYAWDDPIEKIQDKQWG